MKIQIDSHALERAEERGTNEKEIKDVIQTGFSIHCKIYHLKNRINKMKIPIQLNYRSLKNAGNEGKRNMCNRRLFIIYLFDFNKNNC